MTYSYSILLVCREEFIDAVQLHCVVQFAVIQLTPYGSCEFRFWKLRPIEGFQWISWLRNIFLYYLHLNINTNFLISFFTTWDINVNKYIFFLILIECILATFKGSTGGAIGAQGGGGGPGGPGGGGGGANGGGGGGTALVRFVESPDEFISIMVLFRPIALVSSGILPELTSRSTRKIVLLIIHVFVILQPTVTYLT